ncbi:hypothetical protein D9613_011751 [Agrocybe pediades]|uniref:Uncharacterized protein n=1 Tax=Agrocybe pediades TaxID=84607 RepID=A0A8H4VLR3_9AGAR|nr:hypothetical protein D9613_011751 [Agrocybe pediades]
MVIKFAQTCECEGMIMARLFGCQAIIGSQLCGLGLGASRLTNLVSFNQPAPYKITIHCGLGSALLMTYTMFLNPEESCTAEYGELVTEQAAELGIHEPVHIYIQAVRVIY